MKTKEELNALKEEVETVNRKLHELTDEQFEKVSGGANGIAQPDALGWGLCIKPGCPFYDNPTTVIEMCGKYVCHCCYEEIPIGLIDFQ